MDIDDAMKTAKAVQGAGRTTSYNEEAMAALASEVERLRAQLAEALVMDMPAALEVLCELEGSCARHGVCHDDCESNAKAKAAYEKLVGPG